jgi:acetyl-CoA/propionyl-CoA carboxylase biotin carboxyl carrier protein
LGGGRAAEVAGAIDAPFPKLLVANRGEIAVRIIQACRELGVRTVAVYSEADVDALHVALADEAYPIGPAPSAASYLQIERLINVALQAEARAVHPGYGFLAENSGFARACLNAGLVFVGPTPEAMDAMGGKIPARRLAQSEDVPVVPGESAGIETIEHAMAVAARVGYPLAIKASAGGGGRGLKVVQDPGELETALGSARREGQAYFGDPTVFIERYVAQPRHIEVQVLADNHGNAVSLGQRDCSVQRHHQKLIEEAPALIPARLAAAMDAAALRLVRRIGYSGAGTLEFLLDGDDFYFLEMNTRIQVEHTVTEMVTGIDLVQAQIRIAAGEPLWFSQADVRMQGHAIQCRINAEDPTRDFRPAPSTIRAFRAPSGAGVRLDSAVYPGYTIPPHYDSLIAKLITWAESREAARRRMLRALDEFVLEGPPTTIPFHRLALAQPEFIAARATTGFVSRLDLAALDTSQRTLPGAATVAVAASPSENGGTAQVGASRRFQVRVEGKPFLVEVAEVRAGPGRNGRGREKRGSGAQVDGTVSSPMHGVVIRVPVSEGQRVEQGAVVCVVEAMKMENEIVAPHAGVVSGITVKAGDTVDVGTLLLRITASPS